MGSLYKKAIYVFLTVFFIHAVLFQFFKNSLKIPTDTIVYYGPLAENLLDGKKYFLDGTFCTGLPILFPLLLSLVFKLTNIVGLENPYLGYVCIFLQSMSCAFIYLIGSFFAGSRVGVWSSLLLCFNPFFLILSITNYNLNTMPLFLVFFYGSLFFLVSIKINNGTVKLRAFFSGILLGMSCLAWPGGAFIFIPFLLVLLVTSHQQSISRLTISVAFLLGFLGICLSWAGYVYHYTNNFIFFCTNQVGFLRAGLKFDSHPFVFEIVKIADAEIRTGNLCDNISIFRFYLSRLKEDPSDTLLFFIYKVFRPWYATDSQNYQKITLLLQLPYLTAALAGIYSTIQKKNCSQRYVFSLLIITILYFWIVSAVGFSILRYLVPTMGILAIFVAIFLTERLTRNEERK